MNENREQNAKVVKGKTHTRSSRGDEQEKRINHLWIRWICKSENDDWYHEKGRNGEIGKKIQRKKEEKS